jgi:hypothetical protein
VIAPVAATATTFLLHLVMRPPGVSAHAQGRREEARSYNGMSQV